MKFEDRLKVALHTSMSIDDISIVDEILYSYDISFEYYISMFNNLGEAEFIRWVKMFVGHDIII
jgi:hypothetical protein